MNNIDIDLCNRFINRYGGELVDTGVLIMNVNFSMLCLDEECSDVSLYRLIVKDKKQRGRGWGSAIMSNVVEFMDSIQATCHLYADPYDNSLMNAEETALWYGKFGFKINGAVMSREIGKS